MKKEHLNNKVVLFLYVTTYVYVFDRVFDIHSIVKKIYFLVQKHGLTTDIIPKINIESLLFFFLVFYLFIYCLVSMYLIIRIQRTSKNRAFS